jgi:transcriptional regulator PpsR
MEGQKSWDSAVPFQAPAEALGGLDANEAARLLSAAADVTIVLDRDGIVRDVSLGSADMAQGGFGDWIALPWLDTVTVESRPKIAEMLGTAGSEENPRWRQVNHPIADGEVPVRYLAVGVGRDGRVVAIGRDMRTAATLQQRMLRLQQMLERDALRLRQTESRYRLLFEFSPEPVLVVDLGRRRILEANPAADQIIGADPGALVGQPFTSIIAVDDREAAAAMFGAAAAAEVRHPVRLRLARDGREHDFVVTLFRQDRATLCLIRLSTPRLPLASDAERRLVHTLERIPDAFVLTDDALRIVSVNDAFLDLVDVPRKTDVSGEDVGRFLGRPGIDLSLLVSQLREHGSVSNFPTISIGRNRVQTEVILSGVEVADADGRCFGFVVRTAQTQPETKDTAGFDVPRSVDQLTELVGRMPLKDIVRESTDLIERLCIEAALQHTADNRAWAAEILGLSRQSLYSKLHRYGMAAPAGDLE